MQKQIRCPHCMFGISAAAHPDQPFEQQSRGCARSRIEPVVRIDNRADFTAAGGLRQHMQ